MTTVVRPRATLGNKMDVLCFQYLRRGTEEVADRAPIVAAGRQRGYDLVENAGLLGSMTDVGTIQRTLGEALGLDGTRLCLVQAIIEKPNGGYEVHLTEAACTANMHSDEPYCAFTLGVFIGAIHALTGQRMRGKETTCTACGADECIYQIDPV